MYGIIWIEMWFSLFPTVILKLYDQSMRYHVVVIHVSDWSLKYGFLLPEPLEKNTENFAMFAITDYSIRHLVYNFQLES